MSIKINNEYLISFLGGFLIALSFVLYKNQYLNILDSDIESFKYITPALMINEGGSLTNYKMSLHDRLPIYSLIISFLLKIFGAKNFISILLFQSILNGFLIVILIATKNLITKRFFWLSFLLLTLNINLFWSSTLILPDFLLVFFIALGIFFFLKYLKTEKIKYLIIGSIFFGFSYLTKPSGLLLPFFLFFFLILYFFIKKKYNISKILITSMIPGIIIYLIASPWYLYHYKEASTLSLTYQRGEHLAYFVYPCLANKWGCGVRNLDVLEKVKKIISIEFKKENIIDALCNPIPGVKNIDFKVNLNDEFRKDKIYTRIFFDLIKEMDKKKIALSVIGSNVKSLFHSSSIYIFYRHNIQYEDLKKITTFNKEHINIYSLSWLFSQIGLILLRLLQIYGIFSTFKKNKEDFWLVTFLLTISSVYMISSIGIGSPRYRIPIEPMLFLFTIFGLKNLRKKKII